MRTQMILLLARHEDGDAHPQGLPSGRLRAQHGPPSSTSDVALATRARQGDAVAFEAIVRDHYPFLLSYVTALVRSPDVADDLLQNLFIQLWERRELLPLDRPLRPYLAGAASHHVAGYFRTESRSSRRNARYMDGATITDTSLAPGANPAADAERAEFDAVVRRAVDQLPEKARMVWTLRRMEGMTLPEVAAALEISENTAKTHMARATAALRAAIAPFLTVLTLLRG